MGTVDAWLAAAGPGEPVWDSTIESMVTFWRAVASAHTPAFLARHRYLRLLVVYLT